MKDTLKPGLKHKFSYTVQENKTVPFTYPEFAELAAMPKVFATGNMIILMETACARLLNEHLDAGEGSVGTHVDVSHLAATPIGFSVTVEAECTALEGRKATFKVSAHDGVDLIGEGRHERMIVVWDRFNPKVAAKAKAGVAA